MIFLKLQVIIVVEKELMIKVIIFCFQEFAELLICYYRMWNKLSGKRMLISPD